MTFSEFWHHQLIQVGPDSITLGNVILALLFVILGHFVSRLLSRLLTRALVRRVGLEAGASTTVRTLSYYALYVLFVITSLNLVRFPLTIFTIAGGAVAIGVGFGSQNLMNNFMSGLILLLERPIRAGDLISVEGTHGVVETIGGRSTRLRTVDNTQMIVPNSYLLQNSLVNYTLSDDIVRTQISVGVAYGSPAREVVRLIRKALDEHPEVLRDREPRILFADFGDNALIFEALFWLRARTILERRMVASDLRFAIDELFRQAGISIAFPQRDVHLLAARPLEVQLVDPRAQPPTERP
jgi:small-conductance mechanosensitive channel